MRDARVPPQAEFQAGVFSRSQAYAAGWSNRQVRRRLEVGHWRVIAGAAIGPATLDVGAWQLGYAVSLTSSAAVVSHEVAGVLHGFPLQLGETVSATVDPAGRLRGSGLRARRLRLAAGEWGWLRNVPVTHPRRTALDLLADLPWAQSRDLWAWVSTRGVLSLDDLSRATVRRAGWDGTPQLRRLLKVSAGGSLSAAEDRMLRLLRAAALTGWTANARVAIGGRVVAVVDVLFAAAKIVIQVDGWRTHSSREAFQRDRTQQNALTAAGYLVLRFTWEDLVRCPDEVLSVVRAALSGRG